MDEDRGEVLFNDPEYLAEFHRELHHLEQDADFTARCHFVTAAQCKAWHRALGVTATAGSAVAAATIFAHSAHVLVGIASLIAALASGIVTFTRPKETEEQHLAAGRRLGALRVEIRQTLRLDAFPGRSAEVGSLREAVRDFAARKADIDSTSPGISERAFKKVQKKSSAGHYDPE